MSRKTLILHSSLPIERFEAALRENVSSERWWREWFPFFLIAPSATPIVVKSLAGGFRLRRLHYWIHTGIYPMFYGCCKAEPGGTRIEGYFDVLPFAKWYLRFWLGLAVLFAALSTWINFRDLASGSAFFRDRLIEIFGPFAFVAVGFFFLKLGSGDKEFILSFVQEQLLARLEEAKAES